MKNTNYQKLSGLSKTDWLVATEVAKRIKNKRPDLFDALKNPTPRECFAWNVTQLRTENNMTQKKLAKRANISLRKLVSIENAQHSSNIEIIVKLASLFRVEISDLFKRVDFLDIFN